MSLIPTVYRSTDPGAPVLSGTAGSFAALMDAVLVDGYGTGPDAKPGLGWVRAFSDGHKRAYQNSLADGGTGMFWRIDDSNAQYVLNSAFHTMSGIDTGVDGFGGGSNAWGKSITANTTARAWVVIGNALSVYVMIKTGFTSGGVERWVTCFVGDYERLNKAFVFNFGISYSGLGSVTTGQGRSSLLRAFSSGYSLVSARSHSGATVGTNFLTRASLLSNMSSLGGESSSGFVYPYPPTGGLLASRVLLTESNLVSALCPGLWSPEHMQAVTAGTVYDDAPGLPGKFYAFEAWGDSTTRGLLQLEVEWSY